MRMSAMAYGLLCGTLLVACDDNEGTPVGPTNVTSEDSSQGDSATPSDTSTPADSTVATTDQPDSSVTTIDPDTMVTTSDPDAATTTVADTSTQPDVITPACAGGQVKFVWGDDSTLVETHAPITISGLDIDTGVNLECPDDWFEHTDELDTLGYVPVNVMWEHTNVANDPWAAMAAKRVAADSIYDFYLNDYGARETGTFTVTSSTGSTLTFVVKYIEPVHSIQIDDTHEAYAFIANWSREAGPSAEIEGVGQDIHFERMRVRFDGGDWLPWINSEDVTPERWQQSWVPQGGGAADIEVINTCWPTGYSWHYVSNALAGWDKPEPETKNGSIIFRDNAGAEINRINVFGIKPTGQIPAWGDCQVDYKFTYRVVQASNG